MEQAMQSIYIKGLKARFLHPVTGEQYDFEVNGSLFAMPGNRQSDALIQLTCWRGAQMATLFRYSIEPMNNFSLFAFYKQYQELLENWLTTASLEVKITTADRAFSSGPGPIIKINGKGEKRGTNIQIVRD